MLTLCIKFAVDLKMILLFIRCIVSLSGSATEGTGPNPKDWRKL